MLNNREKKRLLRQEITRSIQTLSDEYRKESDIRIAKRLSDLEEYQRAGVVFCYVGRADEIDTEPVLKDALKRGKRVGAPLCVAPGIMEVRQINGMEDLTSGAYGILEPMEKCPLIVPEEIELAVVPCLSCTREGMRLGYGGGYYDRYLKNVPGFKVALCREKLLCEAVCREPHDIPMDMVITEAGIYQRIF